MLAANVSTGRALTFRTETAERGSSFRCLYSKGSVDSYSGNSRADPRKRQGQQEDKSEHWRSSQSSAVKRNTGGNSDGSSPSTSGRFDRAPARSNSWRPPPDRRVNNPAGRTTTPRKDGDGGGEWGMSRRSPSRLRDNDADEDNGEYDGRSQTDDGDDGDAAEPRRNGRWEGQQRWDGQREARDADEYRAPTIRDELEGEVLYGVFPVLNALKASRRKLHALYVLASLDVSKRKDAGALRDVFRLAKEQELVVHKVERHDLNLLSGDRLHQGLVLDCSALEWTALDTFPAAADIAEASPSAPPPVWLALDEVMDPQNFGAIIRSAHCLGASGVLACSRNCAPMSAAVSKASAGTLEVLQVHSCQNMVKTLSQAVSDGWQVLGAVAGNQSQECRKMSVDRPTILVVGNEGSGLRTNIRRACSGLVKVEMGLPHALLAADSLNVSVAASILMHCAIGSALALSRAGGAVAPVPEAAEQAHAEGQLEGAGDAIHAEE